MTTRSSIEACPAGIKASAGDYVAWFGRREGFRLGFRSFFDQWDILLAPANIVNAFQHTSLPDFERTFDIEGRRASYLMQMFYPNLCNLSGHPGTAFPAGLTKAGLPVGLQAIGPYMADRTTIEFTRLIAREIGGFEAPPTL